MVVGLGPRDGVSVRTPPPTRPSPDAGSVRGVTRLVKKPRFRVCATGGPSVPSRLRPGTSVNVIIFPRSPVCDGFCCCLCFFFLTKINQTYTNHKVTTSSDWVSFTSEEMTCRQTRSGP